MSGGWAESFTAFGTSLKQIKRKKPRPIIDFSAGVSARHPWSDLRLEQPASHLHGHIGGNDGTFHSSSSRHHPKPSCTIPHCSFRAAGSLRRSGGDRLLQCRGRSRKECALGSRRQFSGATVTDLYFRASDSSAV